MTQIFMITETLSPSCDGARFQTQLLKLYFLTTLYVDVKEPVIHAHLRRQKNSISSPTLNHVSVNRCRDKIECNLQSQMYAEQTPD